MDLKRPDAASACQPNFGAKSRFSEASHPGHVPIVNHWASMTLVDIAALIMEKNNLS